MTNESGVHPSEFNVLVLPRAVEERTKGGIILPDETKEREQFAQLEGTLIEASPLAFTYHDGSVKAFRAPQPGDRVLFAKYAGAVVRGKDGVDYRLIKDKDLTAVLS